MTIFVAGQSFTSVEAANYEYATQPVAENEQNYGYIALDSGIEGEVYSTQIACCRGNYPSYYNSVDMGYITPVKYQGSDNTCWAFAAVAAAEANAVKQGLATADTIDLSELHMAYYFNHVVADILENTQGDANTNKSGDYRSGGGNNQYNTMTLMSGIGFAEEGKYPYSGQVTFTDNNARDNCFRLKNAHWLVSENSMDNIEEIKYMVQQYGAVTTSLHTEIMYRNSEAMCYLGNAGENHEVTIVGWDDNYSKEKFPSNSRPSVDGAWIVKNSWGANSGKNGYYYVSYQDSHVGKCCIAYEVMKVDDNIIDYQYDGSSSLDSKLTLKPGGAVGAMYQVSDIQEGGQMLESISVALASANTECSIQIYTECEGSINSGYEAYEEPQTAFVKYPGYATIDLDTPVYLEPGTTYAIVLEFNTNAIVYMDKTATTSWIDFTSQCETNQTFYHMQTSARWIDLGSKAGPYRVARLKGHARMVDAKTTATPTVEPTSEPTATPTVEPTSEPIATPTVEPTVIPTLEPTVKPTVEPTIIPTAEPTSAPTVEPTLAPTEKPTVIPTFAPTVPPEEEPKVISTAAPTAEPTATPTVEPTAEPTANLATKSNSTQKSESTNDSAKTQPIMQQPTVTQNTTEQPPYSWQTVTCSKVTKVRGVSQKQKQVTISWNAVEEADGYEIYFYNSKKKSYKKVKTVAANTTRATVTKLTPGTVYKCKVRAYRYSDLGNVYGDYSSVVKISTTGKTPSLKKVAKVAKGIQITWKKSNTADGYEVYVKEGKGKYVRATTVKSAKTTTYRYKKAKSGKTYTVKIRAYQLVNGKKVYTSFSKTKKIKL